MALLLQLYAPLETDDTFHRYLYVLACPKSDCHFSARLAFKLLRAQLPLVNRFWPAEDPGARVAPREAASLCAVCALRSSSRCGACKRVAYCGAAHQRLHWNAGHRAHCAAKGSSSSSSSSSEEHTRVAWGFAELPLRTMPEPDDPNEGADEEDEAEDVEGEKKKEEAEAAAEEQCDDEEEEEDDDDEDNGYSRLDRDPAFRAFEERIAREPKQVLRYTRWCDKAVLWVSDEGLPSASAIPPCERCHAPRRAEFQVLPQLLHFLRVDPRSEMDWGTLVAYTCSASCSPPADSPYAAEVLFRQHFSAHLPTPAAAAPTSSSTTTSSSPATTTNASPLPP